MSQGNKQSRDEKFELIKKSRELSIKCILEDTSHKKLVVAGPGTGKTFLFKKLSEQTTGKLIAITFINNLAGDLRRELAGLSEAGTFHSLCKHLLHKLKPQGIDSNFSYFPKLPRVIQSDYRVHRGVTGQVDIEREFQILNESGELIEFFLNRANYYNAVGHNDSVYRVIQELKNAPSMTPKYELVMVDEYQDFNPLEVELIALLAEFSPIVIVGDDDQALYKLKCASPEFIRKLFLGSEYKKFNLPYCSRCTEVIVNASNELISEARKLGLLKGRIDKKFECYLPGKELESKENPKIILVECTVHNKNSPYMAKFILETIGDIIKGGYAPIEDDAIFDFLIVAKGEDILSLLFDQLSAEYDNVQSREKYETELTKFDCFQELIKDEKSNIGWRALLEFESKRIRESAVTASVDTNEGIIDLLPDKLVEGHLKTLQLLKQIVADEEIDITEEKWLEDYFETLITEIKSKSFADNSENPPEKGSPKNYKINVTTFMGCKGLSSNYVFLAGINDGIIPHDSQFPTDEEVCQLVVGLTRTRKKCHMLYANNIRGSFCKPSGFIGWIGEKYFEKVKVSKEFFK